MFRVPWIKYQVRIPVRAVRGRVSGNLTPDPAVSFFNSVLFCYAPCNSWRISERNPILQAGTTETRVKFKFVCVCMGFSLRPQCYEYFSLLVASRNGYGSNDRPVNDIWGLCRFPVIGPTRFFILLAQATRYVMTAEWRICSTSTSCTKRQI